MGLQAIINVGYAHTIKYKLINCSWTVVSWMVAVGNGPHFQRNLFLHTLARWFLLGIASLAINLVMLHVKPAADATWEHIDNVLSIYDESECGLVFGATAVILLVYYIYHGYTTPVGLISELLYTPYIKKFNNNVLSLALTLATRITGKQNVLILGVTGFESCEVVYAAFRPSSRLANQWET